MTPPAQTLPHPYALRAIYLKSSQVRMGESFDPTTHNELVGEFRVLDGVAECRILEITTPDGNKQPLRSCVFTTRFEFRFLRAGQVNPATQEPQVAAEITAEITTDYQCNLPDFPEDTDLHKWGRSNVLLHAWPYWREFCHSTLARMQLPVTLMPLAGMEPPAPPPEAQHAPGKPRRAKRTSA